MEALRNSRLNGVVCLGVHFSFVCNYVRCVCVCVSVCRRYKCGSVAVSVSFCVFFLM